MLLPKFIALLMTAEPLGDDMDKAIESVFIVGSKSSELDLNFESRRKPITHQTMNFQQTL